MSVFFYASKFAWFVTDPGNLLLFALLAGVILLWTRWRRLAGLILSAVAAVALFVAVVPVGPVMFSVLEDRFPRPASLDGPIDGIVALGGVLSPALSKSRDEMALGSATERIVAFADLARRFPEARLVFTGGSGDPFHPELREAPMIVPLIAALGVDPDRVVFEDQSRNTVENAVLTRELVRPKPGERWILITSAFHMPRAVGCFRKAGWSVIPYPVDYSTPRGADMPAVQFNLRGGLNSVSAALHEFLGLAAYYATGKTDALFPAPTP